jgi:hypothetical protein
VLDSPTDRRNTVTEKTAAEIRADEFAAYAESLGHAVDRVADPAEGVFEVIVRGLRETVQVIIRQSTFKTRSSVWAQRFTGGETKTTKLAAGDIRAAICAITPGTPAAVRAEGRAAAGPVLDADGNPTSMPAEHTGPELRAWIGARVPAPGCPHYIVKSKRDAGYTHCERCQATPATLTATPEPPGDQPATPTREPDKFGVAVGDRVRGRCTTMGTIYEGTVTEIVLPLRGTGQYGNRYRIVDTRVTFGNGGAIDRYVEAVEMIQPCTIGVIVPGPDGIPGGSIGHTGAVLVVDGVRHPIPDKTRTGRCIGSARISEAIRDAGYRPAGDYYLALVDDRKPGTCGAIRLYRGERTERGPAGTPQDGPLSCTETSFGAPHPFEHEATRDDEPAWPEGYELCGRPADDEIHHVAPGGAPHPTEPAPGEAAVRHGEQLADREAAGWFTWDTPGGAPRLDETSAAAIAPYGYADRHARAAAAGLFDAPGGAPRPGRDVAGAYADTERAFELLLASAQHAPAYQAGDVVQHVDTARHAKVERFDRLDLVIGLTTKIVYVTYLDGTHAGETLAGPAAAFRKIDTPVHVCPAPPVGTCPDPVAHEPECSEGSSSAYGDCDGTYRELSTARPVQSADERVTLCASHAEQGLARGAYRELDPAPVHAG